LQPELPPNAALCDFYRFALLLSGNPKVAEQIITETMQDGAARLSELRHESHRRSWLATKIRQRCLLHAPGANPQEVPQLIHHAGQSSEGAPRVETEASILAQRFSALPEPERSALALFYLDLFTPEEIADLLSMDPDELGLYLTRARKHLAEAKQQSE
jgi:RNA polymerase sigma-70 factor (ECF subfamily)